MPERETMPILPGLWMYPCKDDKVSAAGHTQGSIACFNATSCIALWYRASSTHSCSIHHPLLLLTGMMPILHSPGLMMPGQLGPMSLVLLCSPMIFLTLTCAGPECHPLRHCSNCATKLQPIL